MTNVFVAEDQVVQVVQESDQVVIVVPDPNVVQAFVSPVQQIQRVETGPVQILQVLTPEPVINQIALIESGPQGKPGMDSADLSITAAVAIGGQRVIATDDQGMAVYADNLSRYKTVIGISTGAAIQGATVTVKPFGRLEDSSWNWNPEKGLFLGINGLIVQDVPETGAIVPLGHVAGADAIFITISEFIER